MSLQRFAWKINLPDRVINIFFLTIYYCCHVWIIIMLLRDGLLKSTSVLKEHAWWEKMSSETDNVVALHVTHHTKQTNDFFFFPQQWQQCSHSASTDQYDQSSFIQLDTHSHIKYESSLLGFPGPAHRKYSVNSTLVSLLWFDVYNMNGLNLSDGGS